MSMLPLVILALALGPTPGGKAGTVTPSIDVSGSRVRVTGGSVTRALRDHLATLPDTTITATGSTTPRALKDIAADVVNVKAFGAKGDGVTPDQDAFQAAIDACPSSGCRVVVPCGTYSFTAGVTSTKGGIVIAGAGGAGWNVGGCARIATSGAITAFDFGTAAASQSVGVHIYGISVKDTTGNGIGAIRVRNQWWSDFDSVSVSDFVTGFAVKFTADDPYDVTGATFGSFLSRNNKYGITTEQNGDHGDIATVMVSEKTYVSCTSIASSIGVQFAGSGTFLGTIDGCTTGLKLVGAASGGHAKVMGKFEGNALHVHVAGPFSERNVISGSLFIAGGSVASVQIDDSTNIKHNLVANNVYVAPTVGVVDNSQDNQLNVIWEPALSNAGGTQLPTMLVRRTSQITEKLSFELKNQKNSGVGTGAQFLATAGAGSTQGVLRAGLTDGIDVGSTTGHDVGIVRNGTRVARATSTGFAFGASGGAAISAHLSATSTLDFPSTNSGASSSLDIAVAGAANGDTVSLGVPFAAQLIPASVAAGYDAWVSGISTVTVRFWNASGVAKDPASGTFRVDVWQH